MQPETPYSGTATRRALSKALSRVTRNALMRLFFVVTLFFGVAAHAQDAPAPWDQWETQATSARQTLSGGDPSPEQLSTIRQTAEAQRTAAESLADSAQQTISRLEAELEALGPPPEDGGVPEAPAENAVRERLTTRLAEAKALQGRAQRVITRATTLISDVTGASQRRFLNRLETRGPSPLRPQNWVIALSNLSDGLKAMAGETRAAMSSPANREVVAARAPLAVLALLASAFTLFGLRGFALGSLLRTADRQTGRRKRLVLGIGATAARLLIALAAGGLLLFAISSSGLMGQMGQMVLGGVAQGLTYLIVAYTLAAALFSPSAAALRMSAIPNERAGRAFLATMLTAAALASDYVLQVFAEATNAAPEAIAILSFLAITAAALAFYRLALIGKAIETADNLSTIGGQVSATLRRAAMAVAVIAPLLALIGYDFAARAILLPTIHSVALLAAGYLIFALIQEAVEAHLIDKDKQGDRLRLIPILVGFVLLCIGAPILALIWGASRSDLVNAYEAAAAGLVIGDVALSPMDFVTFAVVFGIGYTATRAAQKVLGTTVLPKTGMTTGGASALTAGIGYVGIIVAAIIAISATGIDLSNLAIVAGALSVGVGFGLQTIVSNFVSGVILLIERPVKVGDWISVGTTQGYVKKVNVRSTEIEGFDRSSFIVPNSDLIASTVLNMTHADKVGRVIVPIGVAYGTDPRKIEKLLLEIAKDHPMVMASPGPAAYFMNFGADALEFELRAFINDVNWMIVVKSDLNFAIAKRFGEEEIEIPFAQRDLHIRNPENLMQAFQKHQAAKDGDEDAAGGKTDAETDERPGKQKGTPPDGEAQSFPDADAPEGPDR